MVFQLPPFNELSDHKNRKKKYMHSNVQYEPVYNTLYDREFKQVDVLREEIEKDVSIFNMTIFTILQNIANTILLILLDLVDINNYSSVEKFLTIFTKNTRLIYFGIFLTVVSIYIVLFFK